MMKESLTIFDAIKTADVARLSLDDGDSKSKNRGAVAEVQEGPRKRAPRFCIGKPPRVMERSEASQQKAESSSLCRPVCGEESRSDSPPCDIFPMRCPGTAPAPQTPMREIRSEKPTGTINPMLSSSDMELFQMRYLSMDNGEPIAAFCMSQNPMPTGMPMGGVFDLGPTSDGCEQACTTCSSTGCGGVCVEDRADIWLARAASPMSMSSAGSCSYYTGADSGMDYYSCDSDS